MNKKKKIRHEIFGIILSFVTVYKGIIKFNYSQHIIFNVFTDFQLQVLMKLDEIITNQKDIMALQRQTIPASAASEIDNLLEQPYRTEEELLTMCERIPEDKQFKLNLVKCIILKYCIVMREFENKEQ